MDQISIIVPVYNTEIYLPQCLDSILGQTLKNIEVICVDDGSTDGSPKILDDYADRDDRIKVIHKENGGLVLARKIGLKEATGQYIGYVDSDDWIESDMYEELWKALVERQVDIAMCGRFDDSGDISRKVCHGFPAGKYDKQELMETIYPDMIVNEDFFEWGIFPGVWDKLFRREALEQFQMAVDERLTMGEDAACTYPALLHAESVTIMDKCFYHYRQNQASMVRKRSKEGEEREQFGILYHSVRKSLEQGKDIYDLTEQWKKYLLFLMIPRADTLLEGMESLDYLFPFSEVKRGSDIILYGMGTYGQRLYMYLKESGFCKVAACADRNYKELNRQGLQIISPEEISKITCDAIVVAASFAKVREGISKELRSKYPEKRVCVMDVNLALSGEIMRRFRLV